MAIFQKLSDFLNKIKLGDGKFFGIPLGNADDSTVSGQYQSKYSNYYPLVQTAENQKTDAIETAYKTQEAQKADTQASYEQNKASYGANAEQLAQMGLSGGGYGDYINAQAYAQKRSDIGMADLQAQETIKKANSTYADYINSVNAQIETDNTEFKKSGDTMYGNILDAAGKGQSSEYVDAAIAKYGDYYGWTDKQKQALRDVVEKYKATYSINLDGGGTAEVKIGNAGDIQAQIDNGTITTKSQLDAVSKYAGDKYDTMLAAIQSKTYNTIVEKINGGTVYDKDTIQQLADSGEITAEQASALHKQQIIGEINTSKDSAIDNIVSTMGDFPLTDTDKADIHKAATDRKAQLDKELQEKYQPLVTAVEQGAFTQQDPMTAGGAAVGKKISDLIIRAANNNKAKARTDTENTSSSDIGYNWNTKTFSLGKKATITLADGTSDEVFLKGYAAGKVKKELGSGKEGQIKQASNGSYYVYDGTSNWVMLKNVDEGARLK